MTRLSLFRYDHAMHYAHEWTGERVLEKLDRFSATLGQREHRLETIGDTGVLE